MNGHESAFRGNKPSPHDLAGTRGIVSSAGASGDLPIDDGLAALQDAAESFIADNSPQHDADRVVQAGTALHEVLQRRLEEAAG